jgi:HSP20 family protein
MGEALPPRPFFPVQEEVRRLFQELIHQPWGGRGFSETSHWQPRVDMCETPEAIIVEVELPGVRREDVRIELEGDFLYISGERRTNSERQERNYYRLERSYGRFERQLRLPGSVVREAIRAEFNAGILSITLPKRERRESVS